MALILSPALLLLPYLWIEAQFFHRLSVGPTGYQPEHWKPEVGPTKLNLSPDLLCKYPLAVAWPPAHPQMARQEPAQHCFAFDCFKYCWNMPGHGVHHSGKHQVRWRWKEERGKGKQHLFLDIKRKYFKNHQCWQGKILDLRYTSEQLYF